MNILKKIFLISYILSVTSFIYAQDFDNGEYSPFKGTVRYDFRTAEDIRNAIYTGEEPAINTYIKYKNFSLTIHDYKVYEATIDYRIQQPMYEYEGSISNVKTNITGDSSYYLIPLKDTIRLEEWVFEDLSNRLISFTPLTSDKKDIRFSVSASLLEKVFEQAPRNEPEIGWEKWDENKVSWDGQTPYTQLKDSAGYFRIPQINSFDNFDNLKKELNLRDTLVVIEGEYDSVATVVYKNKACHFLIESIILRIDMYRREVLAETKYIQIFFSYGC